MISKLTIEYDGTGFAGWARQPQERTVQEELERVAAHDPRRAGHDGQPLKLDGRRAHRSGRARLGAGRELPPRGARPGCGSTDCFPRTSRCSPASPLPRASTPAATRSAGPTATACSPGGRAACSSAAARSGGPGRSTASCSTRCAAALVGRHDFTAFTPTETEHSRFRRRCRSRRVASPDGELLEFWIEADRFLRHMNRVLVGTMLDVAPACSASSSSASCSTAGRARRPGAPPPRTGWRSRRSAMRRRSTVRRSLRSIPSVRRHGG